MSSRPQVRARPREQAAVEDQGVVAREDRAALEAWGHRLEQIVSGESTTDGTVVPIRTME